MPDPALGTLPELLGWLAVVEQYLARCEAHPLLDGRRLRATKGARGAVSRIRDELILGDEEQQQERRPFGIERSLPQGDRH